MDSVLLSTIFTGVIALETFVYLLLTRGLWKATKAAADAATVSADAAKTSAIVAKNAADATAEIYRPFVGLGRFNLLSDPNDRTWVISWTIKNYGTLPATQVDVVLDWSAGMNNGIGRGPSSAEIFPQAEMESILQCALDPSVNAELLRNAQILQICARLTYSAADGRRFVHTAEVVWKLDVSRFTVRSSNTESLSVS